MTALRLWLVSGLLAQASCGAGEIGTGSGKDDVAAPLVLIASPASGTVLHTAQTVALVAVATDDVGVASVEIYDRTLLVGTALTSPYTFSWRPADSGSH